MKIKSQAAIMNTKLFFIITICGVSLNCLHASQIAQKQASVQQRLATGLDSDMINAATSGKLTKKLLQTYLKCGAYINAFDEDGNTALMQAAWRGDKDVAQLLITAGADIEAVSNNGNTALMWTAWQGHKDVAQLLIAADANINARNNLDSTALIRAAANGKKDVVQLLIAAGTNINIRNNDGKTARDYAKDKTAYDEVVAAEYIAYVARQEAAQKIIEEERQFIPGIGDIIAGYAYGLELADLPVIQAEEKKECDEN